MISYTDSQKRKVVIVGAGDVGSTHCYALAQSGLAEEIILVDKNEDLVRGQVMDLVHGQTFFPIVTIRAGSPADYKDAHVIVITAGASQQKGETRLDLLKKNAAIIKGIMRDIIDSGSNAVIIMVSNPVDVLTYVALKESGWDRGRIVGSGTVLDSARFRYLLSQHCQVNVHNLHAYILGEHGDSQFAAWSMTHIGGVPWKYYCPICRKCDDWGATRSMIEREVRESAYHIIGYKGATYYAVGLALVRIIEAILRSQNSVLTVSVRLEGEFGLSDVCLSVPCIVSSRGVTAIINNQLPAEEQKALDNSAAILKKSIAELDS